MKVRRVHCADLAVRDKDQKSFLVRRPGECMESFVKVIELEPNDMVERFWRKKEDC